jgi:hypothetical protein
MFAFRFLDKKISTNSVPSVFQWATVWVLKTIYYMLSSSTYVTFSYTVSIWEICHLLNMLSYVKYSQFYGYYFLKEIEQHAQITLSTPQHMPSAILLSSAKYSQFYGCYFLNKLNNMLKLHSHLRLNTCHQQFSSSLYTVIHVIFIFSL